MPEYGFIVTADWNDPSTLAVFADDASSSSSKLVHHKMKNNIILVIIDHTHLKTYTFYGQSGFQREDSQ
jgi:hypothetical protein